MSAEFDHFAWSWLDPPPAERRRNAAVSAMVKQRRYVIDGVFTDRNFNRGLLASLQLEADIIAGRPVWEDV